MNAARKTFKTTVIFFLTLLMVLATISIITPMTSAAAATITLSTSSGAAGSSVNVTGTGFAANSAVGIGFGAEVAVTGELMTEVTSGSGPYTNTVTLAHTPIKPGTFIENAHGLITTDDGAGALIPPRESPLISGTLNYATSLKTTITVSPGGGNTASYTSYANNVSPSAGITTSDSGSFTAKITIPYVNNGSYVVTAISAQGNLATSTFSVAGALSTPTPTATPVPTPTSTPSTTPAITSKPTTTTPAITSKPTTTPQPTATPAITPSTTAPVSNLTNTETYAIVAIVAILVLVAAAIALVFSARYRKNMGSVELPVDGNLKRHLLLPTLLLGYFLIVSHSVFSSTLLVDISKSLYVSIGTKSQTALVGHLVGLVLGLAMGALTLRFKHKSLFLAGVVFYAIGMLGFYFSPNFASVLLVSVIIGLGTGLLSIMVFSLIGGLLPLEKRGWAIGLTISISFLAYVIDAPLFGYIAQVAGWRFVLVWFLFPLSIVCFALGFFVIPLTLRQGTPPARSVYKEAFKRILVNKSAVACLVGTTLAWIAASITIYATSFYRISYSVSSSTGGNFASISSVGGIFGAVFAAITVNRFGRKKLTIIGAFVSGVLNILWTFIPNLSFSVALWAVFTFFAALGSAAFFSLILEQVPGFRASMMSVNSTFQHAGQILGTIIGGSILNIYSNNFHILMPIFGAANIASAVVILLLAKDPRISSSLQKQPKEQQILLRQ